MHRSEIENKIYEILDETNLLEDIGGEKRIVQDIDSIQLISVIVEIEEKFDIEIPDAYLATNMLADYKHLVDVVEELLLCESR